MTKKQYTETENLKKDGRIPAAEICYYLFFGSLLFAKGIGLYDGQQSFRIILLAALICWAVKMCMTPFTGREVFAAAVLVLLGGIVYLSSREKAALISVLVITGMKDIPVKRLFRVGLVIWTACFLGTAAFSLAGVIEPLMLVHNKSGLGFVIRNSLGYTHPNVLHISYVVMLAFWFYTLSFRGKQTIYAAILAFAGNLYIFLYSLSYTGFMLTAAYLILILYFTYRKERTKGEDIFLQCLMPLCVISSITLPFLLKGQAFEIADKIVNWRFRLTKRYLTWENLSFLGTRLDMNSGSIDCSYVYCLIYYGVVLFACFMIGYFFLIRHCVRENRKKELALILGLVAAGFTEPFMFNFSFKNLILPFLGEYLFELLSVKEAEMGNGKGDFRLLPVDRVFTVPERDKKSHVEEMLRKGFKKGKIWIAVVSVLGLMAGAYAGTRILVEPYVIVDKSYSDRVGGREDYEIFGELPEEIVEHSLKIHCTGPETKVYVFEGSTIQVEKFRNVVTSSLTAALGAGLCCWFIFSMKERKNTGG